jgi:hypothetical protein
VLPEMIFFKNGVAVDRIVGFEGFSYDNETIEVKNLIRRLA